MRLNFCRTITLSAKTTCRHPNGTLIFSPCKLRWWVSTSTLIWTSLTNGNRATLSPQLKGMTLPSGKKSSDLPRFHSAWILSQSTKSVDLPITSYLSVNLTALGSQACGLMLSTKLKVNGSKWRMKPVAKLSRASFTTMVLKIHAATLTGPTWAMLTLTMPRVLNGSAPIFALDSTKILTLLRLNSMLTMKT